MENKVETFSGQEAERTSQGTRYQVRELGILLVEWSPVGQREKKLVLNEQALSLFLTASLSSGEEAEGEDETQPRQADPEPQDTEEQEEKEEEELALKLAELKAQEMAELKR